MALPILVVVSRDPQTVCLLLKSPPVINLGPRVSRKSRKASFLMSCPLEFDKGSDYSCLIKNEIKFLI